MSRDYFIRNLLNMKDKNIVFDENYYSEGSVKRITLKFFHGTLTYQPQACYTCGLEASAQK